MFGVSQRGLVLTKVSSLENSTYPRTKRCSGAVHSEIVGGHKNVILKGRGCDIIKTMIHNFPQYVKTHFVTLKYHDKMSHLAVIISGEKLSKRIS